METNIWVDEMSYYSHYLEPKPGYTIEEACETPSTKTADIVEYRGGRATGIYYPATSENIQRFRPVFPPEYYARKQLVVRRDSITVIDKPLYEEKLASEANPFFQLILIAISRSENPAEGIFGLTEEEIVRYLIKEIRVFPQSKDTIWKIKKLLRHMERNTLIIIRGQFYARGLILKGGDRMISWYPGYDPVEYHLLDFIKTNGITSREECHKYIMNHLAWISQRGVIADYLDGLISKKCISVQDNNWYTYLKPLSPFKEIK
jgi:hypothetical protein